MLPELIEDPNTGVLFRTAMRGYEVVVDDQPVGHIKVLGEGGYRIDVQGWRRGRTWFETLDRARHAVVRHLIRTGVATRGELSDSPSDSPSEPAESPPSLPAEPVELPTPAEPAEPVEPPEPALAATKDAEMHPELPIPIQVPASRPRGRPKGSKNKVRPHCGNALAQVGLRARTPQPEMPAPRNPLSPELVEDAAASPMLLGAPTTVVLTTYRLPLTHADVAYRLRYATTVMVDPVDRGLPASAPSHMSVHHDAGGPFVLRVANDPTTKTYLTVCDVTYFRETPVVFVFRTRHGLL